MPNFPPIIILPPWKMKIFPLDLTQIQDRNGSNGLREMCDQEMEKEKYIKINPSSHPKLFTHLLNKTNSISSDQAFSFTRNSKFRGSILHNFHYKNFVLFVILGQQ